MSAYDYIFFDLDGTLTDPALGITNSVMHALTHFGFSVADRSELFSFIGPPLLDSFQRFYGLTPEQAHEAVDKYREYYAPTGIFENEVYAGIPETLQSLQNAGYKLCVATSKPESFAVQIIEHFGLSKYFAGVFGAAMDETRTNKDEVINYALETLGVTARGRVLMIGDREYDVLGAKRCGLAGCIGCLFGYGSREELTNAGAIALAEHPSEIADLILNNNL